MPGGRATLQRVESLHRRKGTPLTLHRDGVTPDVTVYAKVFGAQLEELAGTMADTVRRVKISNQAIAASSWPGPPRRGDVIGGYVTEINVTSPTGIRELDKQFGIQIGDLFIQAVERRLQKKRTG